MHEVCLAFLWHQHQPYYPDDLAGENVMPWVRLHGTKDYWGMAMLLAETPEMRATVNLVPSLLQQLLAYTESGHEDAHLRVSRLAPDDLKQEDLLYLMDNFFMVHPEQMIRPYPRYDELYRKRGLSIDSAQQAAKRFNKRDVLDLQVWSNLVWFHPLAFARDKDLAEFRAKGKHYTQEEKLWLLGRQAEILAEVVPLHRELESRGQIELTTTPYYHPILPLLWDKRLARRAMPEVALPKHLEPYVEDGEAQLRRAVAYHERLFGRQPRGLWPSEGSVCQEMIPAVAEEGFAWMATDEEILSCSTDGWVGRKADGFLRNPEMLYRPWVAEHRGSQVQIVFRDHAMSDQIGFHYQSYRPEHAVDDFLGKVEAIGRSAGNQPGGRPALLSIVLDGENCWEYYPNAGVDFLRSLYRRVVAHPKITPVRVGDYIEKHPAVDRLGALFPGSWIGHNFAIWIGNEECNRAWDALHEARQHLVRAAGGKPREALRRAWEELYIAEGSDWFWWFGDDHSSAQDPVFDRLFRTHLQNVYRALGDAPPAGLARPIHRGHLAGRIHTQPTGLLNVKVDGRWTYFEWINAGRHTAQAGRGTMSMAGPGLLAGLHFGFGRGRLAVRLDARGGSLAEKTSQFDAVRLVFLKPEGVQLTFWEWNRKPPRARFTHNGVRVERASLRVAVDQILELSVPLARLAASTDDPIQFFVQLLKDDQPIERMPAEGAIETVVPSPDFELMMWQA